MGKSTISMVMFNSKLLNYQCLVVSHESKMWHEFNFAGLWQHLSKTISPCFDKQKPFLLADSTSLLIKSGEISSNHHSSPRKSRKKSLYHEILLKTLFSLDFSQHFFDPSEKPRPKKSPPAQAQRWTSLNPGDPWSQGERQRPLPGFWPTILSWVHDACAMFMYIYVYIHVYLYIYIYTYIICVV